MAILLHGTTRQRAERILSIGPNLKSTLSDTLRRAFEPSSSGFVGIVDNLLAISDGGNLEIVWQTGSCRAKIRRGVAEGFAEIPFRKSVFRAILARIALLCNETRPDLVSPYGGDSKLAVGENASRVFQIEFINTPDEQKLVISDTNRIEDAQPAQLDDGRRIGPKWDPSPTPQVEKF